MAPGIWLGFTAGIIGWVGIVINQHYLAHGLFRTAFHLLQDKINTGIVYFGSLSIILAGIWWAAVCRLKLDRHKIFSINLVLLGGGIIFQHKLKQFTASFLWNPIYISPRRIAWMVGTVIFVIFFSWIFIKLKIGQRLSARFKTQILNRLSLFFLIGIVSLNIGVALDRHFIKSNEPHIILISIDCLRADHLGCYGYRKNTSPHIDEFARHNFIFKNCYAQAPWTLPSHMSMLTSLYPGSHGIGYRPPHTALPPAAVTLTEWLKNRGYRTKAFVSGHWLAGKYGFDQGFDTYIEKRHRQFHDAETQNRYIHRDLKKYKGNKLFMFLHYFDVHSDYEKLPYDSPLPYRRMFYPDYNGSFDGGAGDLLATEYLRHVNDNRIKLKEEDLKYIISLYDGGIAYLDRCIAELFTLLKREGLYDNSLIILTSDHGEEFQEHDYMLHSNPRFHQELLHIPLIVKLPANRDHAPAIIMDLVESIDFMPTILDYLKLKNIPGIQGESFLSLVDASSKVERKNKTYRFAECYADNRGVVRQCAAIGTRRWTLLNDDLSDPARYQLFDRFNDPDERFDCISQYPQIAGLLKKEILIRISRPAAVPGGEKVPLSDSEKKRLETLGYL